jgi:hypothetical protein
MTPLFQFLASFLGFVKEWLPVMTMVGAGGAPFVIDKLKCREERRNRKRDQGERLTRVFCDAIESFRIANRDTIGLAITQREGYRFEAAMEATRQINWAGWQATHLSRELDDINFYPRVNLLFLMEYTPLDDPEIKSLRERQRKERAVIEFIRVDLTNRLSKI